MKVLVTGARGQLGTDVIKELICRGHEAVGVDIEDVDITDSIGVSRVMSGVKPDAVIHCAAWTAVDAAEDNEEKVFAINALGTDNIAKECAKLGCKMMYISTDYVFNGQGSEPWGADCKNFAPCNVYGRSKLKGEQAVTNRLDKFFIVRIAWVFGAGGANFVKTMLRIGASRDSVNVVKDQIGTPTYTPDLARLLTDMIEGEGYGYYHATNEGGYIGWDEFARAIFEEAGYSTRVNSVTTKEYGISKAARPFNSRLDKSKLVKCGFTPLPHWRDALKRYLKEIDCRWDR
ncbi:MAG: dTDP-4-dehydrorhamnose reductase [Clostridia bacterium]|nr:dTDP-4-dehydrorhamnose reductase [Clostridia bacterium]